MEITTKIPIGKLQIDLVCRTAFILAIKINSSDRYNSKATMNCMQFWDGVKPISDTENSNASAGLPRQTTTDFASKFVRNRGNMVYKSINQPPLAGDRSFMMSKLRDMMTTRLSARFTRFSLHYCRRSCNLMAILHTFAYYWMEWNCGWSYLTGPSAPRIAAPSISRLIKRYGEVSLPDRVLKSGMVYGAFGRLCCLSLMNE